MKWLPPVVGVVGSAGLVGSAPARDCRPRAASRTREARRPRMALGLAVVALAGLMLWAVPAQAESVEDLLFDLQMVPLDGQPPKPFTLETLAGQRVSLGDFKGQVVLLYFWATW